MEFVEVALLGLGAGTVYALLGQGVVLIYRGSGIINFAQGAIAMLAAQVVREATVQWGMPTAVSVVLSLLMSATIGGIFQLFVLRRLRDSSALMRLIATLGMLLLILGPANLWWGNEAESGVGILPGRLIKFTSDLYITTDRLVLFIIGVVVTALLWVCYQRTRFGLATSAVAEDEHLVSTLGWSAGTLSLVNWVLGTTFAGAAGILLAPITGLSVTGLTLAVIPALAAALIGRFHSFWLTLLGGLSIGVAQSYVAQYVHAPGWTDAVPFIIIIVLVVVRGRALPVRGEFLERQVKVGSGPIRWPIVIFLLVGTGAVVSQIQGGWLLAVTSTLLIAVIGLSFTVVTGYAGQISLAQVTIAGVGAMSAGLASYYWDSPFLVCVLLGAAAAMVSGLIVGLPALRCRGMNLAVVTIGMSLVIEEVLFASPAVHGDFGQLSLHDPDIFGFSIDYGLHPLRYVYVVLVVLALCCIGIVNLRRSGTGRKLLALRSNERAAASIGINITAGKLYAFVVSAGIAGTSGAIAAFEFKQGDLTGYTTLGSVGVLVNTVVGGVGYVNGGFNGGVMGDGGIVYHLLTLLGSTWYDLLTAIGGALVLIILMVQPNGTAYAVISEFRKRVPIRAKPRATLCLELDEIPVSRVRGAGGATLAVRNLRVAFGAIQAVAGVSFDLAPGEVLSIIGPNGAGKTTVIDALCGFVKSTGSVHLGERDMNRLGPTARARLGLGRTFQSVELFDEMSVSDNIRVAADQGGRFSYLVDLVWPRSRPLPSVARTAIADMNLGDDLNREPSALPAGRRRLVGIARCLSGSPNVVLLDEPAAGLDDTEAGELGVLVRQLAEDWGLGVLLVEHNVDLVASVSDRVIALDLGQVIAEGSPEDVLRDARVMEAYLGVASTTQEHSSESIGLTNLEGAI